MSDRRRARHEATRQEILDAAWDLARRQGLTGWSLREVASAVGMRAPSLYVYFDSKDAIYDAMFAEGYRDLLARIDATPLDDDPELLRTSAHLFFTFCVEDAARQQLLFLRVIPGFEPSPEAYALAEETLARGRAVLERAGFTDDADIDLWTAVMTGLATQQLSNDPGGDRWARLVDDAVALFVATRARTAASGRQPRPTTRS